MRDVMERVVLNDTTGCWEWQGARLWNGYARMYTAVNGKPTNMRVHRLIFEVFNGPIPDTLVIDHLCRCRHCVNPDHMELVTRGENVLRGDIYDVGARNRNATHCIRKHVFTDENTYWSNGKRGCKQCSRMRYHIARRMTFEQNRALDYPTD